MAKCRIGKNTFSEGTLNKRTSEPTSKLIDKPILRPKPDSASSNDDSDVVLIHGKTKDGSGLRAIRARKDGIELAEIRPIESGKPIHSGEIIKLKPRKESPLLWNVDVHHRLNEQNNLAMPEVIDLRNSAGEAAEDAPYNARMREKTEQVPRSGPARISTNTYRKNWDAVFGVRRSSGTKSTLN